MRPSSGHVLVNVRLRKFERVSDQFEVRFSVLGQDNFDDVKSRQNVGVIEQLQPGQCAARNQFSFRSVDCFRRSHKVIAPTCLYFDEDERVAIATNNIDFAAVPSPEIAVENFVTQPPKKTAGELFSAGTELEVVRAGLALLVDTACGQPREVAAPPT